MDILNKFRIGLNKTSDFFTNNIVNSLKSKKIDPKTINEIEMALISSDIGLEVTEYLINTIKNTKINDQTDPNFFIKNSF